MNRAQGLLRQLTRHPATNLAAVATLAASMGLAAFVFSFVQTFLFKRLPFADPD